MRAAPGTPPASRPVRGLPGAKTSCALLTILTILLAWPSPPDPLPVLVRPAYYALLYWFFRVTGQRLDPLRGQPMRLVCSGFLVLWLSATAAALVHFAELERRHPVFAYLREVGEHGALFLLGTTLIAYGLMLWIPEVLESHRRLGHDVERQSGQLRLAETTRSQLEQRLVEADRRAILGELAASIAHDLRNPLTIVKGTAESLCRRQRTAEEVAEHTEVIRRNVEKANRTIGSLLDLARPRANAPEPLRASDVLQEVLDLVQIEGRRQHLTFTLRRPASAEPLLHVDRNLLVQALLNLVLNAAQASPAGGTVTLRARAGTTGARPTTLVVEDRGTGLPPELRSRLFAPFFTTKEHGTGLGLLSCRRIAAELGGRLGLFPRHRGGARAVLRLPSAPLPAPAPKTPKEPPCPAPAC